MKEVQTLYIVVPCYNEEEVLHETSKRLKKLLTNLINNKKISRKSKIMLIDDGSSDKTWKYIEDISKKEKIFTGIKLSINRGHQNALLAGLLTAKKYADIIISMDADLQDDINAVNEMIEKYYDGIEIVYGVRNKRKKDTFFKRKTAEFFYKFMKIMGVDIVYNHADYRLTSKKILDELENFGEVNLFLRGIFPLIGYKSDIIYYERGERYAGESKYPLKKMLSFAFEGITSFSIKPIQFVLFLGILITTLSFISMISFIIINLINLKTLSTGSIISIISFLSGLQIICIGLVGEYVGKTYIETKKRPRYIIERTLEEKDEKAR